MLKRLIYFLSVFIFIFFNFSETLVAANKIKKNFCSVSIPPSAELGDFISIKFKSILKIESVSIGFYDSNNKLVQTVDPFCIDKRQLEYVAVVAIPIWWKSGTWKIKIKVESKKIFYEEERDFSVVEKKFKEHILLLDEKNTDIIYKKSKEKDEQLNRYNDVIKNCNKNATFFKGQFSMPLEPKRVSCEFAETRVSKYSTGKTTKSYHWGVDYPAPIGTLVKAAGDGKVVLAENRVVTGWTVIIEHLPCVYTIYCHLDKIHVNENSFVKKGETIAEVGTTGFSTGPHLHWELRINGIPADPTYLLQKDFF